jgi:hypothetical protein
MGYEFVKLRQDGEPNRVHDVNDQNYFRLNQELIGRARMLSLWGAGVLLNTDMLNYTMISNSLLASNPTIEQAHAVHKLPDETMTEWIKPFTDNNEKAVSREHCYAFASNLENALTQILDSPVKPDYETDILWAFMAYLKSCTYGVWVE